MTRNAFRNDGFTLIELIVAIALLAVLVAIAAISLRLAYRALSDGEKKNISAHALRSSLKIVEAQLQSQFPHIIDDDKEMKLWFEGERHYLHFATNYSLWGSRRGYLLVTYQVTDDATRHKALSVSETVAGCQTVKKKNLFEDMDEIYFEYYEKPFAEDPRWVDKWTDDKRYPEKVRLHFIKGSEHRIMLIPVRTGVSANVV